MRPRTVKWLARPSVALAQALAVPGPARLFEKRPRVWPAAGCRAPLSGGIDSQWHSGRGTPHVWTWQHAFGRFDLCPNGEEASLAGIVDGFRAWLCSLVLCCPSRAVTHVTEHHPSRGQMWQGRMALWVSGVPLCGAPNACAYQPRRSAISGRATGVQALQVSHPGSRYPGWCTVVQRCQEWLSKAGTSPARLETRTKESIGGRRQCCACSQSWYGATDCGARCTAAFAGFGLCDPTQAGHAAVAAAADPPRLWGL